MPPVLIAVYAAGVGIWDAKIRDGTWATGRERFPLVLCGHSARALELMGAGAAAVTGLTAQQGIDEHLSVAEGETVLIFGASGAVGTLAVQFAKRRGARVIGAASGADAALPVRPRR